ncbi:MAG: glycosyltransferase family 39 protein [Lachnospiraceae bacterium]|nr:glycosyltransferase family 39 protein [Lachnospiraceae bacterium]
MVKRKSENVIFLLFLLGMAVYYGWRLFALTPWYDELYTYYYFISRGPVYAAIHWPLPNNHVGYSVLSAVLDFFGNSAIGLRGVSWLASLITLCLLFSIGKKLFPKGFALIPVFVFASMNIVNSLAVQGRGYALATCLYLTAIYELVQIILLNANKKRNYIILACSFIWALYTLPSSVYYVIPLCFIGGGWLLIQKRIKEFIKLFITALISAVCTAGLYAVIWLAIGSNLLSKTVDSMYYGEGHFSIILHAPFKAIQTGIQYMLDTPYIQSVARDGYIPRFGIWIKALFENYYSGLSVALILIVCIGIISIIGRAVFKKKIGSFTEWYLLLSFLITPLMLIIQAALPYYRVFSFFAVPVAVLITWLFVCIDDLIKNSKREGHDYFAISITVVTCILCMIFLFQPSYNRQYSNREAAIEDALDNIDLKEDDILCVTDCDQEYLVKYLFDRENITLIPQEADYILLDSMLLLSENTLLTLDSYADEWKLYITYDELPREYLEKETEIYYKNDRVVIFAKKDN